jgi:hypothetical protein
VPSAFGAEHGAPGKPAPPWAAWAASVAGPLPEPVSADTFAFAREDPLEEPGPGLFGPLVSGLTSMLVHLVVLTCLGLWITGGVEEEGPLRPLVAYHVSELERELDLQTVFLDEQLTPGSHLASVSTSVPESTSDPWAPDVPPPELVQSAHAGLDWPTDGLAGIRDLLARVGEGTAASAQAEVDNYAQALDRITQELLRLLAEDQVLLVWCFDQSESMKDDQQEIRARLERVYAELGMTGVTSSDALMTAVTSFGSDFLVHTERPTTDLDVVREAIDAVPVDPSGEEMTCTAVIRSTGAYRQFAKRQDRQMALILVTDESGNREENDTYLEAAIDQAVAAHCKVYVLGREAMFGYPYAHLRWVHPQTGRSHQLPMDRGPETALPAVLQTDGSGPRSDALGSGFGPYGLSRLAWRTGGIFFMLPSVEAELVGAEKLRYDPVAMREYRPDLRSHEEILVDAQRRPMHQLIWKIVGDLDPQRPKVAKMMSLPRRFPADMNQFRRQVQEAGAQAQVYLGGLERAIEALEAQQPAREREESLRWQANYDLIRAQVAAYAARVYLYRAALAGGLKKLIVTPPAMAPDRQLVGWRIRQTQDAPIDSAATEMLQQAKDLYLAVIENHPGTPWAARAQWELRRDFHYPGAAAGTTAAAAGSGPRSRQRAGDGRPAPGVPTGAGKATGAGAGAGGVRGGGGGGGGGRRAVGVGGGPGSGASNWGIDTYQGIELVPEYRAPQAPGQPGGKPRPKRGRPKPQAPTIPVPKL